MPSEKKKIIKDHKVAQRFGIKAQDEVKRDRRLYSGSQIKAPDMLIQRVLSIKRDGQINKIAKG